MNTKFRPRTPPEAPYLIIEKEFWLCPVSLFTGLTLFVVGGFFGMVLTLILT